MHNKQNLPSHEWNFLVYGGEMGAVMRAHDWSASPLGPPGGGRPA
ncbi:hypothetical protein KDH_71460 [Dictyobacter sp. S3.2.2.5]|uniref:Uncharacterized protein n=1 Tax=Dictyobacter halimunensis TaxID=3026934 RepID=A0ABQ6G4Z4_9CHLR|nr:hypothetical protein KDH_71460 [Dictyobacter sp. S3.2.2.5]